MMLRGEGSALRLPGLTSISLKVGSILNKALHLCASVSSSIKGDDEVIACTSQTLENYRYHYMESPRAAPGP